MFKPFPQISNDDELQKKVVCSDSIFVKQSFSDAVNQTYDDLIEKLQDFLRGDQRVLSFLFEPFNHNTSSLATLKEKLMYRMKLFHSPRYEISNTILQHVFMKNQDLLATFIASHHVCSELELSKLNPMVIDAGAKLNEWFNDFYDRLSKFKDENTMLDFIIKNIMLFHLDKILTHIDKRAANAAKEKIKECVNHVEEKIEKIELQTIKGLLSQRNSKKSISLFDRESRENISPKSIPFFSINN